MPTYNSTVTNGQSTLSLDSSEIEEGVYYVTCEYVENDYYVEEDYGVNTIAIKNNTLLKHDTILTLPNDITEYIGNSLDIPASITDSQTSTGITNGTLTWTITKIRELLKLVPYVYSEIVYGTRRITCLFIDSETYASLHDTNNPLSLSDAISVAETYDNVYLSFEYGSGSSLTGTGYVEGTVSASTVEGTLTINATPTETVYGIRGTITVNISSSGEATFTGGSITYVDEYDEEENEIETITYPIPLPDPESFPIPLPNPEDEIN